jgi:hypothetical protein
MTQKRNVAVIAVAALGVVAAWAFRPVRAADPVHPATTQATAANPPRFTVTAQVLPGTVSMTVLYVTDSQANKLHIYRAVGGMDTAFNNDPELYRTYDLTTAGQKTLRPAR